MTRNVTYKNDSVFKYVFGMDSNDSIYLRRFMINRFVGINIDDYTVGNSEVNRIHKNDKQIFKDILLLNNDVKIGIEMEYMAGWSMFNQRRFQYYGFRNICIDLMDGGNYNKLKEFYELIFVDASNPNNTGKLIERYDFRCEDANTMNAGLFHMVVVFLKEINNRVKEDEVINVEKAMLYLIQNETLEGIHYKDEKEIIKTMEKRRKQFKII